LTAHERQNEKNDSKAKNGKLIFQWSRSTFGHKTKYTKADTTNKNSMNSQT